MEKTLAVITARGGSKRIPRKNIKEFCGKPILAYSIEAALKSGVFNDIIVSTDDEEIADIARKYGAAVPFMRSENTSNDYATTADVLVEVLEKYREMGNEYTYACCIYPTAPFVTAGKLRGAMELLKETNADSVLPVTAFSFPPMRGMHIENGKLKYAFPEYSVKRSQDIEPMYHDCGQFYAFNVGKFLETKCLLMDNTKAVIVSELEVQDIDSETDWKLAEIKYQMMRAGNGD